MEAEINSEMAYWIIPEPSGPVSLEKGHRCSGTHIDFPCIMYSVQLLHIATDCQAGLTLVILLLDPILLSFSICWHTNINWIQALSFFDTRIEIN